MGKSGSNVAELGGLANLLTRDYGHLAHETAGAVATAQHTQVKKKPQDFWILYPYNSEGYLPKNDIFLILYIYSIFSVDNSIIFRLDVP